MDHRPMFLLSHAFIAISQQVLVMLASIKQPISRMAYFFTALHGMQTRSSDENSVCLSVRYTREL